MNYHVFQDSLGIYSTIACNHLERVANLNEYKVFNITNCQDCKTHNNVLLLKRDWNLVLMELLKIPINGKIYFHCYNPFAQFILLKIRLLRVDVSFHWVFWSGEFYNLPEFANHLCIKKSHKYINDFFGIRFTLSRIKNRFKKFTGKPYYIHADFINSFKHIDSFFGLLRSDYLNVVNYSGAGFTHLPFTYQSILIDLPSLVKRKTVQSLRIMVNHSGDLTLNHFDALNRLSKLDCSFNVVLPLAYGDKKYIADVKNQSIRMFGLDRVEVWEDYMPLTEYAERLKTVDVAVFNCSVQQGVGNIVPLLGSGTKIFFREENGFYQDLKSWGMHVYSFQSEFNCEEINKHLTETELKENINILNKYFSIEAVDTYYNQLVQKI